MKKIIAGLLLALLLVTTIATAKLVIFKPRLQDMAEKHKDKELIQLFATDDWVCNEPSGSIKYSVVGDKLYIDRLYLRMLPEAEEYTLKIGDFVIPFEVTKYETTFCQECEDGRVPKCISVGYTKGKVSTAIEYDDVDRIEGIHKNKPISVWAGGTKILDGTYSASFVVIKFV